MPDPKTTGPSVSLTIDTTYGVRTLTAPIGTIRKLLRELLQVEKDYLREKDVVPLAGGVAKVDARAFGQFDVKG